MANIRQIKQQQSSVQSINKITNSMKLVSIAKSRQALQQLVAYREYYEKFNDLLININNKRDVEELSSTEKSSNSATLWIVFASDMGFASGYNSKIINLTLRQIQANDHLIFIGRRGKAINRRLPKDITELKFYDLEEFLTGKVNSEIIALIQTAYHTNSMTVKAIYTKAFSQLSFEPEIQTLLPIAVVPSKLQIVETELNKRHPTAKAILTFEPNKQDLLKEIEPLYLQILLNYLYYEVRSSEHASRRIAMENATKNGDELLQELTVKYNKTRQAKITQEISEIVAGVEAS